MQFSEAPDASTPSGKKPAAQLEPLPARAVAVPALPVIEPVIVLLNVLLPEKVLLSASAVEEANLQVEVLKV